MREGRTYTEVTPLDREARERELARIIGGEVTGPALEAAREMLEKAAGRARRDKRPVVWEKDGHPAEPFCPPVEGSVCR